MPASLPPDEAQRLAELKNYEILDTVAEATYDAITYLASQICDVPIALISIVDEDRLWFKSRVGVEATETHRDLAFCAYAIHDPTEIMVVTDASLDDRFNSNPLVTGDPSIRFYAGAPLATETGNALGTLCVIDREPRTLTEGQETALEALSVQVMALLELRRTVRDLEQKQVELAEATRQRESFMATVSHEIRTPLTSVVGYVELLQGDLPDGERAEMLTNVAREAADVESLIEDLLIAARAEADSLRVAAVSVNLPAQIAQVMESLATQISSPITVETQECRAVGDPARVRQIVRNMLTNAFRYGGPNTTISSLGDEETCHVVVADDGEGIAEADCERIFDQFVQVQNGRDVPSSVGLGLPISRLLAEKMGGSLTYRFEDGLSKFDLSLPAEKPPG
ncbi:MAG: GAF domain-containing sensor histidine kinase [bacterium]|nr:GAF domain-containing sensor histidine kinase [bacterium]